VAWRGSLWSRRQQQAAGWLSADWSHSSGGACQGEGDGALSTDRSKPWRTSPAAWRPMECLNALRRVFGSPRPNPQNPLRRSLWSLSAKCGRSRRLMRARFRRPEADEPMVLQRPGAHFGSALASVGAPTRERRALKKGTWRRKHPPCGSLRNRDGSDDARLSRWVSAGVRLMFPIDRDGVLCYLCSMTLSASETMRRGDRPAFAAVGCAGTWARRSGGAPPLPSCKKGKPLKRRERGAFPRGFWRHFDP